MTNDSRSRRIPRSLLAVVLIAALSRAPFVTADYGLDPDSARVGLAAIKIRQTGAYHASRLPGHPVEEVCVAVLSFGGARVVNSATVAMSVLAAAAFFCALRKLGCRDAMLCAIAFAFVPIIFVNSTNAMDYVWSLGFLMAAFCAIVADRAIVGGILLGLAIGCRITAGAMLLPLGILVLAEGVTARRMLTGIAMAVCAVVVGGLSYAPLFSEHGASFLRFVDTSRPLAAVIRFGTLGVWGGLGCVGLLIALVVTVVRAFLPRRHHWQVSLPSGHRRGLILASVCAVALFTVAFLRLPHEPAYLIPAVPFVLILLARTTARPVFVLLCILLLVAPFVDISVRPHADGAIVGLKRGAVVTVSQTRAKRIAQINRLIEYEHTLADDCVVEVGSYAPIISFARMDKGNPHIKYEYKLTANERAAYRRRGFRICKLALASPTPIVPEAN